MPHPRSSTRVDGSMPAALASSAVARMPLVWNWSREASCATVSVWPPGAIAASADLIRSVRPVGLYCSRTLVILLITVLHKRRWICSAGYGVLAPPDVGLRRELWVRRERTAQLTVVAVQ